MTHAFGSRARYALWGGRAERAMQYAYTIY